MRKLLLTIALILGLATAAYAAPEPGNPDMDWQNNGPYDGISVIRDAVVQQAGPPPRGVCTVVTAPDANGTRQIGTGKEVTKLPAAQTSYKDTNPLVGRACYAVCGFTLIDFSDGLGPVANFTGCSNPDATKPKGPDKNKVK